MHFVAADISCTFDDDLCGWVNEKGDEFDWTRQQGETRTSDTGPESDHTSGRGKQNTSSTPPIPTNKICFVSG